MSADANKQLIRAFYDDVWHAPGQPQFDRYLAPQQKEYRDAIDRLRATIPDIHWTLEALVAEGELVAERWTVTGTHRPSGEPVTGDGMSLFVIRDGKIVEHWAYQSADLLEQIRRLASGR
jgi:predicted ester cyclase